MISTETQVGWQDYLALVMRRRWYFIIPCLISVAVAMAIGMGLPKIYRADTLMLVQDQQVINPLIRGLAVSTPVSERMRILREELLSWTSLSRLSRELKLDRDAKSPLAFEGLIKRLQKDIIVQMRGHDLVTISYENPDPKLAQTLVNTLTTIYMNRNVESQSAETGTAIQFLDSEMAVYKKKLEDSERALRDFKELYVMQMPVATQLNQQVIESQIALAQLLVDNTEEHPRVVETKRQIQELKIKRNEEIKHVITSAIAKGHDPKIYQDMIKALDDSTSDESIQNPTARAAKEAYHAWVQRLDSPLAIPLATTATPQMQVVTTEGVDGNAIELVGNAATSLSLAPREEQELARLTRDYEVHARTYQSMQERLERANITQRLGESDEGTKFKVLEPARLPLRPVRPDLVKLFLLSLCLGVFFGAALAFIVEYLDQSFQSAEDAEAALELPVLGTISTIVTEQDLDDRRARRKRWVSVKTQWANVKTYLFQPIWSLIDRALVRWGL